MTTDIITIDPEKCTGCSKCLRVCPVSTASHIVPNQDYSSFIIETDLKKCIACGECIKACPQGARSYNDDSDMIRNLMEDKSELSFIISPSVITALGESGWTRLLSQLRKKENIKIYDVSFGADICTWVHQKLMKMKKLTAFISSGCSSAVSYIEKYRPELVAFLSPVYSPESCMAVYLKKYLGVNTPVVLASSCISKRYEASAETFDYCITYENLSEILESENDKSDTDVSGFEFDSQSGTLGQMYCRPGGLRDGLNALGVMQTVRVSSGPCNIYMRLDEYMQAKTENRPDGLEIYHCKNGCSTGSAGKKCPADDIYVRLEQLQETVQKSRGTLINKDKIFKDLEKKLDYNDFLCEHSDEYIRSEKMSSDDEDTVFKKMLKTDPVSRTVDCGACGYDSCRTMCSEIYFGRNVRENCIEYLKKSMKKNCEKTEIIKATMQQQMYAVKKSADEILSVTDNIKKNPSFSRSAENTRETRLSVSESDLDKLEKQAQELSRTSESIANKFS